MRLQCFRCGKSVSNELPDDTVVRAIMECPECIQDTDKLKAELAVETDHRLECQEIIHGLREELAQAKTELATVIDEVFRLREELAREKGITCPQCGRTSYNLNDIKEKYCGHCHQWHEDMKK